MSRRCARCRACMMRCWSAWRGANRDCCLRPAIRRAQRAWPMFSPRARRWPSGKPGAGAQMLLDALLTRAGAAPKDLRRLEPPCLTGPDLAAAIRAGKADCGIATRAAAKSARARFRAAALGEFRSPDAPAQLLPALDAGADRLSGRQAAEAARRRTHRIRPGARRSDPLCGLIKSVPLTRTGSRFAWPG